MRRSSERWLILILLLATSAYAVAEDVTLTTFYPSPRGIFETFRTTDQTNLAIDPTAGVVIGRTGPPTAGKKLDVAGTIRTNGLTINGSLTTNDIIVHGTATFQPAASCTGQLDTNGLRRVVCNNLPEDTVVGNELLTLLPGAGLVGASKLGPGPGGNSLKDITLDIGVPAAGGIIINGTDQVALKSSSFNFGCAAPDVLNGFNLNAAGTVADPVPSCVTAGLLYPLFAGTNITLSGVCVGGSPPRWNPKGACNATISALGSGTARLCANGEFSRGVTGANDPACYQGLQLRSGTNIGFTGSTNTSETSVLTISNTLGGGCVVRQSASAGEYIAVFCLPTETLKGGGCARGTGNVNHDYPVANGAPATTPGGYVEALNGTSALGLGWECDNSGDRSRATAICCQ